MLIDIKINDPRFSPEVMQMLELTGMSERLNGYQPPKKKKMSRDELEFNSNVSLRICDNIASSDNPVIRKNLLDMTVSLLFIGKFTSEQFLQIAKIYLSSP